jgi:predicted DNA-binding transcriptional regulator YafY
MSGTPTRLLALLSLLQTPRAWTGAELAERLEVSGRTVRRDIDRLRDAGYPVEATLGVQGGYRLVAGTAMPPLLLDDDEAVAIAIGLRTVTTQAVDGIDEASARALAKLDGVLPARLRTQVATVAEAMTALPGSGPVVDPAVLTALARAIAGRSAVRFDYQAGNGNLTRRDVEPEGLVVAARRWYLVGHDVDRGERRMFRVDRITDAWSPPGRLPPRLVRPDRETSEVDPTTFVAQRLYESAPTFRAAVTLRASASAMRPALRDGETLVALEAATCRLVTTADTVEWLAARLLTLGVDFEVYEPPELVAHLRVLAARVARSVIRPPDPPSTAQTGVRLAGNGAPREARKTRARVTRE